jgi:Zn-dependent peptidase ImmA (M78 family)
MSPAEQILISAGVAGPSEIDVTALAWLQGAVVKECQLRGCEALIRGYDSKAVIRIEITATESRKRFSIAHELGHWHLHRGRNFRCTLSSGKVDEALSRYEREADRFAADLLLPDYLFRPAIASLGPVTSGFLQGLAEVFQTSLTTTTVRLAEADLHPLATIIREGPVRRRFQRSLPMVGWFLKQALPSVTDSTARIVEKSDRAITVERPAADWFDIVPATSTYVREVTFFNRDGAPFLSVVQPAAY